MRTLTRVLLLISLFATPALHAQPGGSYDHFRHGFELDGAHRYEPCESCHVRGIFPGTPRQCAACHDGSGLIASSGPSPQHITTTQFCEACHTTVDWAAIVQVDHSEVIGSCEGCHDGHSASGLPPDHIQTTAECDVCHNTVSWPAVIFDHAATTSNCIACHNNIDVAGKSVNHILTTDICEDCHSVDFWEPVVMMDHTQVIGSCVSCHDGTTAAGKNPLHVASSNNCDNCHTTVAWLPAVFDHADVMPGTCKSCHDGMSATGLDADHIATTAECDVCHTTIAWLPANFDHQGVMGSCSTCHDGVQATGVDVGHFMTVEECDHCHTTDFWTPDIFVHASANYPGDHRDNLACTDCHQTNADQVTWPSPAYLPNCAGCHANDFKPGPHKQYENPDVTYTVTDLQDCTGACHVYTDSSLTTIEKFRPGPEHTVNGGDF